MLPKIFRGFEIEVVEMRNTYHIVGLSSILEDVALHYFGNISNIVALSEVGLPNIGIINYLLVRHKIMRAEVDDFVAIQFQPDFIAASGNLKQSKKGFLESHNSELRVDTFDRNTNDTIKQLMIQIMNQEIVYKAWNIKCYWIIQEYIYDNLARVYSLSREGFVPEHASRFALYNFVGTDTQTTFTLSRFLSITVDEVYQAAQYDLSIPNKDKFMQMLNTKLRAEMYSSFKAFLAQRR